MLRYVSLLLIYAKKCKERGGILLTFDFDSFAAGVSSACTGLVKSGLSGKPSRSLRSFWFPFPR